jgi:PglZ domain-containing protein
LWKHGKLFAATLGLTLKTRDRAWSAIADELWRFLLFSEFVFDLPISLPEALTNVPRAQEAARPLVDALCERLRSDRRTQPTYIERAAAIEQELNLPECCQQLTDLGQRDTFPVEERLFLQRAMQALEHGDLDQVRTILQRQTHSVWRGTGESQAQWGLVQAAVRLVDACEDYARQLSDHARDQDSLIDFYLGSRREADRLHREFEQAVRDALQVHDFMTAVIEHVRMRYRRLVANVQVLFTKHLEASGWPPVGRLANADVFDRLVAPQLQESGRRVAYVLVDALRYELGVALAQQLAEDGRIELHAAFTQLPSITPVGMASLLPGASQQLFLRQDDTDLIPTLGEIPVTNVNQRMDVLRKRYGQRFAEMPLHLFVRAKQPVPDRVELLVLRSVEIDSQMENNPETTLGLIHDALKRIRVAIHTLQQQGFHEVVIATDHGFCLNMQAEAGDVCVKPQGHWVNAHDRSLVGNGAADSHSFVVAAERVGIRGDFAQFAGPRTMAPYRAGLLYFHGGISLQEAVVPVLTMRLESTLPPDVKQAMVMLSYRNGATRITTRLPVIEVSLDHGNLFAAGAEFEILLEAHDRRGQVVGEAKAGGAVNSATGTMTLKPGERVQVPLKMQLEFEGKFKVKALNPTTMATYCSLNLQTDYTV